MRVLLIAVAVASAVHSGTAQQRPSGQLFRGPLIYARPVTLVEPGRGLPLEFGESRITWGGPDPWARLAQTTLETDVRSRTIRVVPVSGILLRVAVGPTTYGMMTFRMRPRVRDEDPEPFRRIPPDQISRPLRFVIADEERPPGLLLINPVMKVVFTVERIESAEGQLIFENPDATELLWEALGRPSFSTQ